MSSLAGQTFAGYEIISQLGRGGMGSVYKARQPKLDRLAALKIMAPELAADPDFVARFKREATAAASLSHPNVVQVYSAGESEGTHYIAMEFVDGETLKQHIERQGRLDAREALAITVYVAEALQYGWNKAKLIHRDIKPDNIFLSNTGEVKVGDLGLAKTVGGATTSLTQTGMMMGSPHYISPEQARGVSDIDFRTDIYSLGCTLYHMLTGRPPYEGPDPLAVITRHVNDPPPAIFKAWPTCPIPVALLVGKMLAKQRHERPASYEDLIDQLREVHGKLKPATVVPVVAGGQPKATPTPSPAPAHAQPTPKPVVAKPTTPRTATGGRKNSRTIIYAAAGIATAVLIAGAGLFIWSPWKSATSSDSAFVRKVDAGKPLGAAPSDAPRPRSGVLFDGHDTSVWQHPNGSPCQWQVTDGALVAGEGDLDTREKFQDFDLHIEFAVPRDAKQGNSGIYLQGRYEVQILDSFGKPANDICCGAIFRLKAPVENVSKPPDEWQSFDITFHAARFDADGAKTANARVSVIHNGRIIHDDVEIPKSTGKGEPENATPGPIRLQAYGSPVRFRNIRIKSLDTPAPSASAAAQQPRQTIDLLAITDPVKDRIKVEKGASHSKANAWERRGTALAYISDGGSGKLAPPVAINARSYEIEVDFERLSGPGRFHVDLPLDATRIIPMNFDSSYKMINCRAGNPWPANRGPRARVVVRLDRGKEGAQDHVTVRLDGELVVDWRGDVASVAQKGEPHPDFPGQPITSLYLHKDSYEVRFWQLRVFDGEATALRSSDALQSTINLLPLVDPQKDAIEGDWKLANDGLALERPKGIGVLKLPYVPPAEYDFEIEFTPQSDGKNVNQHLVAAGSSFAWKLNAYGQKPPIHGFDLLDDELARNRSEAVAHNPLTLEPGRRCTSKVEVRRGSLRALVNGEEYVRWSGDFNRLSLETLWKLPNNRQLALSTYNRGVVFHRIEVREVTGKGTFTRGAPASASK
ncbi:MAG: DUF1080 domain-containing protein [Verrucomicrobia bacterium]|nr:DUF1080 domain-containing protein [Verrucomicrobiota bacterium]